MNLLTERYDAPLAILIVSFAFRASLNTLQSFSPADETSYLTFTTKFSQKGIVRELPRLTQEFLDAVPGCTHPFRYAWYALCALICRGDVSFRKLAWISTVAGSFAPPLAYLLARQAVLPALPAALLVLTSPLSMGMGRRALQDATLGSLTVLSFLAAGTGSWYWVLPTLTVLLFVKEVSALGWAGYVTVYLLAGGTVAWGLLAFGLPPLLFGATSWKLLGLTPAKAMALYTRLTRHENDAYAMGFGRGPVHTYVLEFALVSPLVAVLAVRGWTWSPLAIGWLVYVGTWSVLKFKNYRFFTGADIVLRVLAAATFTGAWWTWVLLAACVAADVWMFRRLFIQRNVYDPVVYTVEQALDMVP